MITTKRSVVALAGAVIALSGSSYAAAGYVPGFRDANRPSSPGNGHCGLRGGVPPCGHKHHPVRHAPAVHQHGRKK